VRLRLSSTATELNTCDLCAPAQVTTPTLRLILSLFPLGGRSCLRAGQNAQVAGTIYSTRGSMLLFALAWYFSGPVYLYPCQFRPSLAKSWQARLTSLRSKNQRVMQKMLGPHRIGGTQRNTDPPWRSLMTIFAFRGVVISREFSFFVIHNHFINKKKILSPAM